MTTRIFLTSSSGSALSDLYWRRKFRGRGRRIGPYWGRTGRGWRGGTVRGNEGWGGAQNAAGEVTGARNVFGAIPSAGAMMWTAVAP
jgi:hypothetical protein